MTSCISFCSGDDSAQGEGCDVLIVGLEGSGKSLLCRRLQALYPKDGTAPAAFSAYTVATNGIQLAEVPCPKNAPFRNMLIREVGGQMTPLWPQYYDDCRIVLFLVDVSDTPSIAAAAVELCEMMQHPKIEGKPVCVVLSKQDQPLALSRQEIELAMHLSDLQRSSEGTFAVKEVSSIPGAFPGVKAGPDGPALVDSAELVMDWLVQQKCVALGLPVPGRSDLAPAGLFTPKWATNMTI